MKQIISFNKENIDMWTKKKRWKIKGIQIKRSTSTDKQSLYFHQQDLACLSGSLTSPTCRPLRPNSSPPSDPGRPQPRRALHWPPISRPTWRPCYRVSTAPHYPLQACDWLRPLPTLLISRIIAKMLSQSSNLVACFAASSQAPAPAERWGMFEDPRR